MQAEVPACEQAQALRGELTQKIALLQHAALDVRLQADTEQIEVEKLKKELLNAEKALTKGVRMVASNKLLVERMRGELARKKAEVDSMLNEAREEITIRDQLEAEMESTESTKELLPVLRGLTRSTSTEVKKYIVSYNRIMPAKAMLAKAMLERAVRANAMPAKAIMLIVLLLMFMLLARLLLFDC